MNDKIPSVIRFKYEIELLEDLHAGSGLGSVWVDRTLRRDGNGTPFIPASHVKGVWRDAMVRLVSLGVDGFSEDRLANWFGAAPKHENDKTAPKQGKLHCPRLTPTKKEIESLVWMQTARERYSRRPKDDTLRATEYLPAGIRLKGEGFFEGSAAEFDKLRTLVDRVDRYGGNRSRGDGRIKRICFERPEEKNALKWPENAPGGIRLLLRARAPVRVPRTGSPGNIIESDTRIPGRMLAGAIISQLLRDGTSPETLFSGGVAIGDALPLSPDSPKIDSSNLKNLEVLPAPFEYRIKKHHPKRCNALSHTPAWAKATEAESSIENWEDTITKSDSAKNPGDQTQLKRLPAGTYLQRLGKGAWRAYRQPLELAMRNRRGSDLGTDVESHYGRMDSELFSNEQMPAGTCFVADIRPLDTDAPWDEWWKAFKDHFDKAPVLFTGRGRAPVEIIALDEAPSEPIPGEPEIDEFRLTLTSDAIIRTEWLGFHQRLTLRALYDALGEKEIPAGITAEDVSEARIDRAFNAATRLPRPSVMMLRAGSSIEVRGSGVRKLWEKLKDTDAIGERQHEGLGRFRLDLDLLSDAPPSEGEAGIQEQAAELRTESVARFADHLASTHAAALKKPSTSQLGNVRARLDAIGRGAAGDGISRVDEIRRSLFVVSGKTRGGAVFYEVAKKKGEKGPDGKSEEKDGPLAELIEQAKERAWSIEDIRLAWRLMLARDDAEEEQDGREDETEKQS